MNKLFVQICFFGQSDTEGWMDILILIVIAVIYAVGAIIKTAKSKKQQEEQSRSQQLSKPKRKPSTGGRGLLEHIFTEVKKAAEEAQMRKENITTSRTVAPKKTSQQAILQKHPGQAQPVSQIPVKAPKAKPIRSRSIPKAQSEFEKSSDLDGMQSLPGFTSRIGSLSGKYEKMPAETVEYKYLSDVLSDYYKDPEAFKKAILHYEILGKPLALRDPSKGIT